MKKQQRIKIKPRVFDMLDSMDRLIRDHNYQAMVIGNDLNKHKMRLAKEANPEIEFDWKRGFVDVGIDWKTKELVISPTMDPAKKAEEAAEAIRSFNDKNGRNQEKTDTTN